MKYFASFFSTCVAVRMEQPSSQMSRFGEEGLMRVGPHQVAEDELQGVIFDFDGTLLDSMALFYYGWPAVGADPENEFDLTCNEYEYYDMAGIPMPEMVRMLYRNQKNGAEPSQSYVDEFLNKKMEFTRKDQAERGSPKPIEPVIQLLRQYKERGVPVAVATSGWKKVVQEHIQHAGLSELFEDVEFVYGADVTNGKPAPDIFLKAAELLEADPSKCRAFEDGESGLMSAHRAGMEVIDVTYHDNYPFDNVDHRDALRQAKVNAVNKRTWVNERPRGRISLSRRSWSHCSIM